MKKVYSGSIDALGYCGLGSTTDVVWCSMLQCVAVCCSVLQCVAWCCNALQYQDIEDLVARLTQCVAACCSVLQCVAVCCSVLQCVAVCGSIRILQTWQYD